MSAERDAEEGPHLPSDEAAEPDERDAADEPDEPEDGHDGFAAPDAAAEADEPGASQGRPALAAYLR